MNQSVSQVTTEPDFKLPLYYVVALVLVCSFATGLTYIPIVSLLPDNLSQHTEIAAALAMQLTFLAGMLRSYQKYYRRDMFTAMALTRPRHALALLGLGVLLVGAEQLLLQFVEFPEEDLQWMTEAVLNIPLWLSLLTVVILAPLVEELFFRQMFWVALREKFHSPLTATLISGALWSVIHTQYSLMGIGTIFLYSLLLGYVRHKSGSVFPTILMHMLINGLSLASLQLG